MLNHKKILIVEDEPHIRTLIDYTLEDLADVHGLEVLMADNGEDGLRIALDEQPYLIFVDVMMPKMSGYDLTAVLRNEASTRGAVIVMLTARAQKSDRERADTMGVNHYLTKPFDPEAIRDLVRTELQLS